MKKSISLLMSAILVLSITLTGCGAGNGEKKGQAEPGGVEADTGTGEKKDTLIIGQYGDAPNLDPHNCLNDNAMRVMINIYDPLIRMDENFKPVPCVAENWEISEDGLEYTFKIKKGIKFHNGD